MTSSQHGPDVLGDTHATMAGNKEDANPRGGANLVKPGLSSDCRLQLACMKPESLVIADQHAAVNTFPGLVHTARHTMGVAPTVTVRPTRVGAPRTSQATGLGRPRGGGYNWGEVVTR